MKNKTILLGLNELNFDYIKFYVNQGLLPNKKTVSWYLENNEWMEKVTSGKYQEYYQKMYGN
jgi:dTDP-D-glucose 4,6-dehydratase